MSEATGYSLWLVPERGEQVYSFLDRLICRIAAEYHTPKFDPHVTLLGGIEGAEQDMREKTRVLTEEISPYEIMLGEIASNGIYFQILFSRVEQTHAVMNANVVAEKVFGVDKGGYFPHFSFAYGDLSSEQVATLREVMQGNSGMHFCIQSIELWRTEGAVEEWRQVGRFPFGKS